MLTSNAMCAVQNRLMVASRSLGKTFGRLTHWIQNFTVHTNDKSKLRITPHDVTAGHCKSDLFQFTRYTISSFLELRRPGYLPKESNMFKKRKYSGFRYKRRCYTGILQRECMDMVLALIWLQERWPLLTETAIGIRLGVTLLLHCLSQLIRTSKGCM